MKQAQASTQVDPQVADNVQRLLGMYRQNPNAFTRDQVKYLYNAASQLGLPMDVPGGAGRMAAGVLGGALNGITAGIVPADIMGDGPITKTEQGVSGLAEALAGALVGGAVGKAGALALRGFGKGLIAKAGAAALAEKGAERLVAREVAAGVKAGGEASSIIGRIGPLMQKAFNGDKMLQLARAAQANPALASALESGVVGFGMGSWNDLFDNPAEALSQGLIGGGIFGGVSYMKGKKALSAITAKAAEGVKVAEVATAAEKKLAVAGIGTPAAAPTAGGPPIVTPPPAPASASAGMQATLPAVGAAGPKMASNAQKVALGRLGTYDQAQISAMTADEAMAGLKTGTKGKNVASSSGPRGAPPIETQVGPPPEVRAPTAKGISNEFLTAMDGGLGTLGVHARENGVRINEVKTMVQAGVKPADIDRLLQISVENGKISTTQHANLKRTLEMELKAKQLGVQDMMQGLSEEDL